MARPRALPTSLLLVLVLALPTGAPTQANAVEVPPEGSCPPYPLRPAGEPGSEDVIPRVLEPGTKLDLESSRLLQNFLPKEVWENRDVFFFEGMRLEVGPCHRRYPAPAFFIEATRQNAGRAKLDSEGNLAGYAGVGLPFPTESIDDAAPDAGWKWAWDHRYRYQAAGFRGAFRIHHVARRGKQIEHFEGNAFYLPLHGLPPELWASPPDGNGNRFVAGGEFQKPSSARGVAWRQFRLEQADALAKRSDELFVWVPDERRLRRAAPVAVDGLFMPSYTRGSSIASGKLAMPGDATISTPDFAVGVTEHWRRGFVGFLLRPNAYRFELIGAQDVLAPINAPGDGYPRNPDRSYGPSGLSVANDRWDVRRAVVLEGTGSSTDDPAFRVTLYIDALTLQPLYLVSRRANRLIYEVGIFVGRFSAEDPLAADWPGDGKGFGVIVPVAQTFVVQGEGGWLRESFDLATHPPSAEEVRDLKSTRGMQSRGK